MDRQSYCTFLTLFVLLQHFTQYKLILLQLSLKYLHYCYCQKYVLSIEIQHPVILSRLRSWFLIQKLFVVHLLKYVSLFEAPLYFMLNEKKSWDMVKNSFIYSYSISDKLDNSFIGISWYYILCANHIVVYFHYYPWFYCTLNTVKLVY